MICAPLHGLGVSDGSNDSIITMKLVLIRFKNEFCSYFHILLRFSLFIPHKHLLISPVCLNNDEMNPLSNTNNLNSLTVKRNRPFKSMRGTIFLYTQSDQIGSSMTHSVAGLHGGFGDLVIQSCRGISFFHDNTMIESDGIIFGADEI